MNYLAIECSQANASLYLCDKHYTCLYEASWHAQRNHDSHLFPALEEALNILDQGQEKLTTILIGAGPGSYGGVRVSLAAASGIAMVKDCKVHAIDSWQQLAQGKHCVISDARRGAWTLRQRDASISVCSSEEIIKLQESGISIITVEEEDCILQAGLKLEEYACRPLAQGLVESWLAYSKEEQERIYHSIPLPIYVRPPHITKAKRKPWEF